MEKPRSKNNDNFTIACANSNCTTENFSVINTQELNNTNCPSSSQDSNHISLLNPDQNICEGISNAVSGYSTTGYSLVENPESKNTKIFTISCATSYCHQKILL